MYKNISELPQYIQDKAEKLQRQWMAVWNSAYEKAKDDGKDDKEAEQMAFQMANGVIKKEEEKKQESDLEEGGSGSGNFGHAGRPGKVGGSQEDSGGSKEPWEMTKEEYFNKYAPESVKQLRLDYEKMLKNRKANPNWIKEMPPVNNKDFVEWQNKYSTIIYQGQIEAEHAVAVYDAVAMGRNVPKKVLDEFPDLKNEKKESIDFNFKEAHRLIASNKEGKQWDAILLAVGRSMNTGSNGYPRYYSREAIQGAVNGRLFEKAPVTLYKFDKTLSDHVPLDVAESKPEGLFGNTVGWAKDVRFGEYVDDQGVKREGAIGTVYISEGEDALRKKLIDMWESGRMIGFSIDGAGSERPMIMGGETVDYVDVISDITENTLVTFPAAGGKAIRLAASEQKPSQGVTEMKLEQVLALIKELRPNLLEGKDLAAMTESDAEALLKEAMKPVEKIVEKPVDNTALENKVKELAESVHIANKSAVLDKKLREANVPDEVKAVLKSRYDGKNFAEADLDADLKANQDAWAKMRESNPNVPGQIKVGSNDKDKLQLALDGMFEGRDLADKDGKKVHRFVSIKEAYAKFQGDNEALFAHPSTMLGDSYWFVPEIQGDVSMVESYDVKRRRALRESRMREATGMQTSDWAQALADAINKKMLKELENPAMQDWRKICSDISSFTNFQSQKRVRVGGYGILSTVSERGTYSPLTSPGDEQATFTPAKKGGTEDLTMEMFANDDVQAIRQIPIKLGRAAAQTLYRDIFGMLKDNLEQDAATTLASSGRGNYITTALSSAAYGELRYTMRSLAKYGDSYDLLGVSNVPNILVVPNELEDVARRIQNSDVAVSNIYTAGTSHYNTQTEPNVYKSDIKDVIVVDFFTDATDWWGVANPANAPTLEVSFYQGRQEPELFIQDMPNVGSMFTADKITYKIRYIYGFGVLDYRSFGLSHQ